LLATLIITIRGYPEHEEGSGE